MTVQKVHNQFLKPAFQDRLHKVCMTQAKQANLSEEDLYQDAFFIVNDAMIDFDGRGDLEKYVLWRVKMKFLERRRKKTQVHTALDQEPAAKEPCRDLFTEIWDDLGLDAFTAGCVLIQELPAVQGQNGKNGAITWLAKKLKWDARRCADALNEIKHVLFN